MEDFFDKFDWVLGLIGLAIVAGIVGGIIYLCSWFNQPFAQDTEDDEDGDEDTSYNYAVPEEADGGYGEYGFYCPEL